MFERKMAARFMCLFVFCLCVRNGLSKRYGDSCSQDGAPGKCLNLGSCPSVLADPTKRWSLKRCGFDGDEPIVCCLDRSVLDAPVATSAPMRATTRYTPSFVEYRDNAEETETGGCAPISDKLTAPKNGRKAWDKCLEYQERLLYPCERGVDILGRLSRSNNCNHKADELILGGKDAKRDEIPHMALLGYGDSPDTAIYQCGGSVISEKFILTAGHCTFSSLLKSKVTFAKVGVLRRSEQAPASRVHRIVRIVKHKLYKPPSKYHDIALLETENEMKLDHTTIPACLDIGEAVDYSRASVTGWGHTANLGQNSDTLQKVTLMQFSAAECARAYRPGRYILQGVHEPTQMCYGDHSEEKDTCQGDSGGPLHVNNDRIHCMFTIVGVTSFGKKCGLVGVPGMYTRVAPYVPWIESIVWP